MLRLLFIMLGIVSGGTLSASQSNHAEAVYRQWVVNAPSQGSFLESRYDSILAIEENFKGSFKAKNNDVLLHYQEPAIGSLHYTEKVLHIRFPHKEQHIDLEKTPEAGLLFELIHHVFTGKLEAIANLAGYQFITRGTQWLLQIKPKTFIHDIESIEFIGEPGKAGITVLINHSSGDWRQIGFAE
jgi:hypothetical protein